MNSEFIDNYLHEQWVYRQVFCFFVCACGLSFTWQTKFDTTPVKAVAWDLVGQAWFKNIILSLKSRIIPYKILKPRLFLGFSCAWPTITQHPKTYRLHDTLFVGGRLMDHVVQSGRGGFRIFPHIKKVTDDSL